MADQRVDLPDLGAPTADTHAHLDMLDDPVTALVNASLAGVSLVATVVDLTEEPERTFDRLAGWLAAADERLGSHDKRAPEVRVVVGVHPHNASRWTATVEGWLRERAAEDQRVAAIGEAGLDFHYDNSPRDAQRAMFRAQIAVARDLGKPLVLHLREAHDEGYRILAEEGLPPAGCILHCFTEGPDTMRRFLDLGCHVSFAGPVTFARADTIREAAAEVPLGRLLVETDAPFLAPAPYRGRKNEPAWCVLAAARVAEVKGLPAADVAEAALRNARALLGGGA